MNRFLIIRQDKVGDVVLLTPLIQAIKTIFPKSFIAVYVKDFMKDILTGNPNIDEIIPVNENIYKSTKSIFHESNKLRRYKFDYALIPMPEKEIAYLTFLAFIPRRITFSRKLFNIITCSKILIKNFNPPRHESDYMLDFARYFDKNIIPTSPKIYLNQNNSEFANKYFQENNFNLSKSIIAVNPGSGGSVSNWSTDNYVELVKSLSQTHQIFINIGPSEIKLKNIFEEIKNDNIIIASPSLKDLISLISKCSVLISSSTGTMHIAAALNIPTITFFCPQKVCSPTVWGAIGNEATNLIASQNYCFDICNENKLKCTLSEIKVDDVIKIIKSKY